MDKDYLLNMRFRIGQETDVSLTVQADEPEELIAKATLARAKVQDLAPTNGNGDQVDHAKPECPVHHRAKPGRFGLFCPAKVGEAYCDWTYKEEEASNGNGK